MEVIFYCISVFLTFSFLRFWFHPTGWQQFIRFISLISYRVCLVGLVVWYIVYFVSMHWNELIWTVVLRVRLRAVFGIILFSKICQNLLEMHSEWVWGISISIFFILLVSTLLTVDLIINIFIIYKYTMILLFFFFQFTSLYRCFLLYVNLTNKSFIWAKALYVYRR